MKTKVCPACSVEKPTTEFHKDRSKKDGLNLYCKTCQIARQRVFAMRPARKVASAGMKWCGRCKTEKPVAAFFKSARTGDGLDKRCKACSVADHAEYMSRNPGKGAELAKRWRKNNPERSKDHGLKNLYGISIGAYADMLARQGGSCAICGTTHPGRAQIARFHVDHCHETGLVRGLLCHGCNVSLGHFKHDPAMLQSAIDYLRRPK